MFKLTFLGAGSTIFAKNVLGDCILSHSLGEFEIALFDIDPIRLEDSYKMISNINRNYAGLAHIKKYDDRKEALRGAKYIVNAIQVGGYKPLTVVDFAIPKKYGLRHTIGDTLNVPGIFRGLRTIHVLEDIARDIHEVCPNAYFLNYTNPMAIVTGYMQKYLNINAVGLCHSVQVCAKGILETFKMQDLLAGVQTKIFGINHQAWLLEIKDKDGRDLYPIIKAKNDEIGDKYNKNWDLVRLEMMRTFGYYMTESSEHTAEYTPWFIKYKYPDLIQRYHIPLDDLLRRYEEQTQKWEQMRGDFVDNKAIEHEKSYEFASHIIDAIENDKHFLLHGNVLNTNSLITNLPTEACVEVPCDVSASGIIPQFCGPLPEVCAAINRTNINVQILTMLGANMRSKDLIIQAAALDPHTGGELSLDDIKSLVNDMFVAQKDWLPEYK